MSPHLWLAEIPITAGRDDARREALDELRKAKYDHRFTDAVQRLLNAIAEQAQRIFDTLNGTEGTPPPSPSAWAAATILAVLFVGLIGFLIARYGLPRVGHRVQDMTVETDADADPQDYRDAAQVAADAGDWQRAVLESFRALIREMEIRTIIERRPARTAFETARLVARALPGQEQTLFHASQTFNEVMYGHRPATATDFDIVRRAERTVVAAADEGYVEAES